MKPQQAVRPNDRRTDPPARLPGLTGRRGRNRPHRREGSGNFSEHHLDLDRIIDDAPWQPSVVDGAHGIHNWGASFINPEGIAALMIGTPGSR
ncbi:MAG TPA: hypothetical protein VHX38_41075 [Pseudonocardiaceae bacterium]|nr:hypothetical protein [Pseudonocardiaceae bacterium]